MLALSRIDTDVATEPVAVAATLGEVLEDLRPLLDSNHAQVTSDVDPDLRVIASPTHVRSLLQNLISNAAKYHPEERGNHITVSLSATPRGSRLVVADDGIGVAAEDQERMMQPFVRLKSSKDTRGTGVSLAAVTRIVSHNQGEVDIDSAPGKGLRFSVLIPAWTACNP